MALLWEIVAQVSGAEFCCRSFFFNPIPTWMHAVLVALVPVANFIGWQNRHATFSPPARAACRALWGAALVVAVWFGIRFVGTIPIAAIGFVAIIYFGLGLFSLLPLSPYIGLLGLLSYRSRFNEPAQGREKKYGVAAALVVLLALHSQTLVSNYALKLASSDEPLDRSRGVQLLRTWGDRQELAGKCMGGDGEFRSEFGDVDLFGSLGGSMTAVTAAEAQQIFFRVYGEPFYTTTTMGRRNGMRGEARRVDVAFDTGQGGDDVGQNVRGLSLTSSRMDGHIEADLALAYLEWTLVFRNTDTAQREARAQIALPPGAVVSRLTLWVDGEEREAAFAGNSQVKAAYKKVVTVLRRDPVLVTSRGQDRVMMQCFPVPPGGGTMKVRLGITVPMDLPDAASGSFRLPVFLERNFALRGLTSHDVWLQSTRPIATTSGSWITKTNEAGSVSANAALKPFATLEGAGLIKAVRAPTATLLTSRDPVDPSGTIITRVVPATSAPPTRVVLALDASHGMSDDIAATLAALPTRWRGVEIAAVVATHETTRALPPRAWDESAMAAIAGLVRTDDYEGGQDNLPALVEAWDLAAQSPRGIVLWLHGPCAEKLSEPGALRQRMERTASGPQVFDFQLATGPHRLVEKLESLPGYRSQGIARDTEALRGFIARQRDGHARDVLRTRETGAPAAEATRSDSPHPARLWANERVHTLLANHTPTDSASAPKLAARYYLVTPVSGAVVLETKQQFDEAGLEAAPSNVMTIVPEPATFILAALGIAGLLLRQWFVRRRAAARFQP